MFLFPFFSFIVCLILASNLPVFVVDDPAVLPPGVGAGVVEAEPELAPGVKILGEDGRDPRPNLHVLEHSHRLQLLIHNTITYRPQANK